MNLAALFSGCFKVLGLDNTWPDHFDLSPKGFQQSFLAVFLSLPLFYICAAAVLKQRELISGDLQSFPAAAFLGIILIYGFMFPLSAFILASLFKKDQAFRPWVIVRHWTMFFAALVVAALFALTLAGVLPFMMVNSIAFFIYMCTLLMDIRIAQKVAGFEIGAAILAGCITTASGLLAVLIGVSILN